MPAAPRDYDTTPERYRQSLRMSRQYSSRDLYAYLTGFMPDGLVLDVGCAEGVLSTVLGSRVIGLDASPTMLRAHPGPAVLADAVAMPFRDNVFDAVTAIYMLYHLDDPSVALREAYRVLRPGGRLLAVTVARDDSPEFAPYRVRHPSTFDAEEAPAIVAGVFDSVTVDAWDAPLLTLPSAAEVRSYLIHRKVDPDVASRVAADVAVPFTVTKRGALVIGHKARPDSVQN